MSSTKECGRDLYKGGGGNGRKGVLSHHIFTVDLRPLSSLNAVHAAWILLLIAAFWLEFYECLLEFTCCSCSSKGFSLSFPLPLPWLPLCSSCQSTCWLIYVFNKQHDRLKMSALSTVIQNVTTASRRILQAQRGRQAGWAGQSEGAERAQDALDYLTFCMAHRI